jgi:hypothetical protein
MKRLLFVLALVASPLAAQTAKDSTHAHAQRIPLDSIQRFVLPALSQYCGTKGSPGYVRQACLILTRQLKSAWTAESVLIVSAPVAVVVVAPPSPVESTTTVIAPVVTPVVAPVDTTHAVASGEPTYSATTGTLIVTDSMDEYTSPHAMWLAHLAQSIPGPHIEQTDFGEDVDSATLITGRNGSGKALRLIYSGVYQDAHSWTLRNGPTLPDTTTHYFSYSARVTVAGPMPLGSLSVKWFMAWHAVNRVQWNTHDYLPCNHYPDQSRTGPPHTFWQVYDNGPSACQGDQPVGPYPDLNAFDGQWHRYTYQYRPNTVAGSHDGIARMWIDGVKVIDVSATAASVTPVGGWKTWCELDDVDALNTAGLIGYLQFGANLTTDAPPFTIDIDDFVWWHGK